MSIIELKNIVFNYDSKNSNNSFQLNIPDWKVEKGSFFSVIGPNGCGKSTLLKLIAGINNPKQGDVLVEGKHIDDIPHKEFAKVISYVPQSTMTIFPFSVYEIVMMGRTPYMNMMGFEKDEDRRLVNEALDLMKLNDLRKKGINEISGGEAQRVFIARSIAQQADIILLDEPSSHLDLHHQLKIFDMLLELCEQKSLTIIAVSHDLNLVGIYSKEIIFMNDGTIAIDGDKRSIFTKENIKKIFAVDAEVKFSDKNNNANVYINPQS